MTPEISTTASNVLLMLWTSHRHPPMVNGQNTATQLRGPCWATRKALGSQWTPRSPFPQGSTEGDTGEKLGSSISSASPGRPVGAEEDSKGGQRRTVVEEGEWETRSGMGQGGGIGGWSRCQLAGLPEREKWQTGRGLGEAASRQAGVVQRPCQSPALPEPSQSPLGEDPWCAPTAPGTHGPGWPEMGIRCAHLMKGSGPQCLHAPGGNSVEGEAC